jgi:hypothetical protein
MALMIVSQVTTVTLALAELDQLMSLSTTVLFAQQPSIA